MTSLTLVRRIKARPSIVFDALTTPQGIACWWGPDDGPVLVAESDPQVGGRFRVRFRMLGTVEIHREFITAAARWIFAAKLWSVLSARMAMRLNSLSLQKKFSIR